MREQSIEPTPDQNAGDRSVLCPTCHQVMPAVIRPRVCLDTNHFITECGTYKMSPMEAEFLYILAARAPGLVRHDTIDNALWGAALDQPKDTRKDVQVLVHSVRSKIAGSGWIVANEWHQGYRLKADL